MSLLSRTVDDNTVQRDVTPAILAVRHLVEPRHEAGLQRAQQVHDVLRVRRCGLLLQDFVELSRDDRQEGFHDSEDGRGTVVGLDGGGKLEKGGRVDRTEELTQRLESEVDRQTAGCFLKIE